MIEERCNTLKKEAMSCISALMSAASISHKPESVLSNDDFGERPPVEAVEGVHCVFVIHVFVSPLKTT